MHQLYIHPVDDDDQNIPFIFLYSYCFFRYGFFTRPSVRKLFPSKTFGLIVLCLSLNSIATTFTTQERICPIGGERFTEEGVGELDDQKLPKLLELKYKSAPDGIIKLGGNSRSIRQNFIDFQKYLYESSVA